MHSSSRLQAPGRPSLVVVLGALALIALACGQASRDAALVPFDDIAPDPHSSARPREVAVRHLELDLLVDFEARQLIGSAILQIDRRDQTAPLVLDTRGLDIESVRTDPGNRTATYRLGEDRPLLGQALEIDLPANASAVLIHYSTRPEAAALQWLEPRQTSGGERPFLFSQSQAILARTWIPLQDTPTVRITYEARVRVPAGLLALMSAENPQAKSVDGFYEFRMQQPVPSYLMAIAAGDLEFRPMGERAGVYAEPAVVERAANEFADTEKMIAAAEALYGPYRWGRYDLLVLPPSFPYGGMENPRLTFLTPTIIAGDRSLVSLVAHELAHSWSGNLVTNATWNDFWLNEGFTVYFEHRIVEAVFGRDASEMHAALALQGLRSLVDTMGDTNPDTHLRLALAGRDPDEGMTEIAYDKGYFFLRSIEETVGRESWDAFLRSYFDRNAFRSIDTDGFLTALRADLLSQHPGAEDKIQIAAWVDAPGLPANIANPQTAAFAEVDRALAALAEGAAPATLATSHWNTQQWLRFLRGLPAPADRGSMAALDAAFDFTNSGNAEIASAWFERAIAAQYEPAYPALEKFLVEVGRRKFLRPLYTALAATPEGRERARAIYARARPGYHSVSYLTIDSILGWTP